MMMSLNTLSFIEIFRLLEDMRVFNHIRNERPSTSKLIDLRLQTRLSYTESQIKFYKTKTVYTDLLFLYLEKHFSVRISLIFQ